MTLKPRGVGGLSLPWLGPPPHPHLLGTRPGKGPIPPNQSKRGARGCCLLWGGTLLVTAEKIGAVVL